MRVALFLIAFGRLLLTSAQTLQPGQKIEPRSLEWPRFFATNGYEFAVYQPQISQWPGNHLEGRFVVAVRPAGSSNETYGVVSFEARTEIDKVNRLVTLEDFLMKKEDFPTQKSRQREYGSILQSALKHTVRVIPLDHLEAVFAASADIEKAKVQAVRNDPPRIIYTTQPSLLILVDGAPMLKPLLRDYERVVNTRAVLLWNTNAAFQVYYLYAAGHWQSAPSLEGPWTGPPHPPGDLSAALEAAEATKQVDLMLPKDTNAPPWLHVYVSTTPAELIQTSGSANILAVPGTELLYVLNTDNAIFFYMSDVHYYILISGRWFKAPSLYGPWAFVPAGQLPSDFARIPADHPKFNVLASVPGTPQSREAVIANSIPQTATINREQAKLTVVYEGAPSFSAVVGTPLAYAVNTATPVIRISASSYYACQGGVWFGGANALGPWQVATSVPGVIYTIPASCPIHYVTYAYVYGSTPSVVYVGYTPGYAGTVVAPGGVVVYGTGYYYPPVVIGAMYVSYPPTYGYGASLALGVTAGFAFGFAAGASWSCWCEPSWGCYGWAAPYGYSYTHVNVNSTSFYTHWGTAVHTTGSYGYNAYTGTQWASQRASTFNPYTGVSGSAQRGAAYNPYSGNYAAGRSGSYYNPATGRYGAGQTTVSGNVREGTESFSSQGVAGNARTGTGVAWNNGNMYADRNGNAYKYNRDTGAQRYNASSGSWQNRSSSSGFFGSGGGWSGRSSWAGRENFAQSLGSERFSSWRGSGGGGWGGFRGGGGFRR